MGRLTERLHEGCYGVTECKKKCRYDNKYCIEAEAECPAIADCLDKLGRLEDLEEAGRLVVLPDRGSRALLSKALLDSDICPRNLGMKEIDPCSPDTDCKACWEAALKGGE